ncbi:oxidoreductase molybdopterin binding domain-containing protein [Phlyctema vagabunda]|uniref:Nitrate reductase [NADPH] n=1 Tax=Phlyctema vagabunda TaxID=108571 RepID=A0ABR4PPA0_9HELO
MSSTTTFRSFPRLSRFFSTNANHIQHTARRALHSTAKKSSKLPPPPKPAPKPRVRVLYGAFAGGSLIAVGFGARQKKSVQIQDHTTEVKPDIQIQKYRLSEVKLHDGQSERPWVTKGNSVYDITDWVAAHPGGDVILRAAGGSIDPYWKIFTIHKRQDVYDILEQFKIGEIHDADLTNGDVPVEAIDDPFTSDPTRDARLRTLTARPCNAETPGEGLAEFLTPNELFYVRNHMWVPVVQEPEHNLTVELPNGDERVYTMKELKERFKQYKVTATLQCAGNRRNDMTKHARQTNGLQWNAGAISSAEWEGVKLRDVLADAGLNIHDPPSEAKHAQFSGLEAYAASIPMCKAIDPAGDVLLAFKMNGAELPRDHGYPLRVIVPGNVAARSVKWLRKIVISDEESLSQWQRRDYKCFGPNVGSSPDWDKAKSIQEMPITSAITAIKSASASRPMAIEGYAYSGGGREIVRVDISMDNGETWDQAELLDDATQAKGSKAWCWKRWRYTGNPNPDAVVDKTTVLVKATDEAYNTQPENYRDIYNARGNLATAWHRVEISPGPSSSSDVSVSA